MNAIPLYETAASEVPPEDDPQIFEERVHHLQSLGLVWAFLFPSGSSWQFGSEDFAIDVLG